jgi:hypothetical protein
MDSYRVLKLEARTICAVIKQVCFAINEVSGISALGPDPPGLLQLIEAEKAVSMPPRTWAQGLERLASTVG